MVEGVIINTPSVTFGASSLKEGALFSLPRGGRGTTLVVEGVLINTPSVTSGASSL